RLLQEDGPPDSNDQKQQSISSSLSLSSSSSSSHIDVGTDTAMNHATTTRSASPGLRPSLGGSLKSLPHEIRDLARYLKFVNRENECYQCVEVFQNLYKKYHEM